MRENTVAGAEESERVAGEGKPVSSREFGTRGGASMDLDVCPVLVMPA